MSHVTCPSGLILDTRGLSIKDGRYLSDDDLFRTGEIEDKMMSACIEAVIDPGVYQLDANGKLPWGKVLLGDRLAALIGIRQTTYPGHLLSIPIKCPVKACREPFDWDVDLDKFMATRMQHLPEATKVLMKSGERCTAQIPNKNKWIKFRVKNGDDRRAWLAWRNKRKAGTARQREKFNELTHGLIFWDVEIEGIKRDDIDAKLDFLETLTLWEGSDLRAAIEAFDCGLDTEIEIKCPFCGHEMVIDLPFDKTFFNPPKKKATTTAEPDPTPSTSTSSQPTETTETKPEVDPFALDRTGS